MYVGKKFRFGLLWHFARKNLFRTFLISLFACVLYIVYHIKEIAIPFLPIGTIGTAVAFYIGLKNNNAYDRLWEARRLWGGITNVSRILATMIVALVPDKKAQEDILYRHLVYVNTLRLQLRRTIPWATSRETLHQTFVSEAEELLAYDIAIKKLFTDYNKLETYERFKHNGNIANLILRYQIQVLTKLKKEKIIDEYEHSDLIKQIAELFNLQGGCERIKSTPLFRQYSIFSRTFVDLFIYLLPFGLLTEMQKLGNDWHVWLTIPFSMLISWVFFTMEQIGEFSENPFDNSVNDIPISTICRNIEIDVLDILGVEKLPEKLQPHNDILL